MKVIASLKFCLPALAVLACGCYPTDPKWEPEKGKQVYRVATRQLPPEPVYGDLRWVRPPQMLPTRKVESSDAQLIRPIIQFEVTDRPICEAALVLAASAGYRSYCSSRIGEPKLTLASVGTMDELAVEIEKKAGIKVAVDHGTREVRFLSGQYVAPKF